MNHLDEQMRQWATRLRDDLKIGPSESNCLASTISSEVSALEAATLNEIRSESPVCFSDRLDELVAFQAFVDVAHTVTNSPAFTRAQVIVQNYVCFVYLGDAWFKRLGKCAALGSTTKKCVRFLTNNPIRAFRNALAHANWKYNSDFSGLEFWARKGADQNEPMQKFAVSQTDLNFWQALARCTAYSSFTAIQDAS